MNAPFHLQPESVRVARFVTLLTDMQRWGYDTRNPELVFAGMAGLTSDQRFKRLARMS